MRIVASIQQFLDAGGLKARHGHAVDDYHRRQQVAAAQERFPRGGILVQISHYERHTLLGKKLFHHATGASALVRVHHHRVGRGPRHQSPRDRYPLRTTPTTASEEQGQRITLLPS
jgi:hypothetical protein